MKGRDGFVLIAVIFITGLLAITTTAFVANVRSNTMFARALLYNQQLEAAADGISRLIAFQFSTRDQSKPFPMQSACRWDKDVSIYYDIQDQAGLVDLNTANPALLVAVLQGLGETEAEASNIAAAIADYKDPDGQAQNGGDEAVNYRSPGAGPSNGPFATTAELDRIPLIADKLYVKLLPLVTVHSQQTGFDPAQAPKPLLDTLEKNGSMATNFASPSPARVYSIVVTAKRQKAGIFTRSSIINLTGQPDKPFAVLKWNISRANEPTTKSENLASNCF